jgi:type IV secretion system protein VirB6
MGFFVQLNSWLDRVLTSYIAVNTARIAEMLEPMAVTLAVLYTVVWGYLQITGKIEEPFITGTKRILVMAAILGVSIHLWLFNEVIVDTFFVLPSQLAARVVGQFDPANIVDGILLVGSDVATLLIRRGSIFNDNLVFYFAGGTVYVTIVLTALYTIFLLTLSRIALSVLIALGPLFIALLFFESTKRFFESWVAQLANYALITILTVLVAALMMTLALTTARDALTAGGNIEITDAVRLVVASGLTFLVMRQVMPMAAGLASGLALSTFGAVSAALSWGFGGAVRHAGQVTRGLTDAQTTRWDPLSRKAGYYVRRGVVLSARAAMGPRENAISRR